MKDNIFDRLATKSGSAQAAAEDNFDGASPPLDEPDMPQLAEQAQQTPSEIKQVVQELLKHGCIEESSKPAVFRLAIVHEHEVNSVLEPLDLLMRLDTHRGVAFLLVAPQGSADPNEGAEWAHPLVKRQRLTLEQTILVAILRQAFAMHEQELGVGQGVARVAVDDLMPQFLTYFKDSGSDAKNESRLLSLLDQLKTYGIVSEVDAKQEVIIRPLIAYLANPSSLSALLDMLKTHSMKEQEMEHSESCPTVTSS